MEEKITIERSYSAAVEEIWELWTTPEGIEAWWAPDGFSVEVSKLDLVPGGELHYAMTATAPAQIEFVQNAGMPPRRERLSLRRPNRHLYERLLTRSVPSAKPDPNGTLRERQRGHARPRLATRPQPTPPTSGNSLAVVTALARGSRLVARW